MLAEITAEKFRHDNIDILSLLEESPERRILHMIATDAAEIMRRLNLSCEFRHKGNGSNHISGKRKETIGRELSRRFPLMELRDEAGKLVIADFQNHAGQLGAVQSKPGKYRFDMEVGDDECKLLAAMRTDGSALVKIRGNDSDDVASVFISARLKGHITARDEAEGRGLLEDMIRCKTFA